MKFDDNPSSFLKRHIGPTKRDLSKILNTLNVSSLEELIEETLPKEIKRKETFSLPSPLSEEETLKRAKDLAKKNKVFKSYIGQGYYPCHTPAVIKRNILENPLWYTPYTPYQAELAQGRLEALLNFQTMITDLTGMEISNSSLLDEGTAAAEALSLAKNASENSQALSFFADKNLFPQTLDVIQTRSQSLGWKMEKGHFQEFQGGESFFAALVAYPNSRGEISPIEPFLKKMQSQNIKTIVITDLLSLCLLKPPGEMGADVVVGSSQRFGVPLFFGGPHGAFFATRKKYARQLPGRLVGLSKDRLEARALRLALQTREQHIRRERATSNICTSQALLAVLSGFYAVYHGPKRLKNIALRVHNLTKYLEKILMNFPGHLFNKTFFDTLLWEVGAPEADKIQKAFLKKKINVGRPSPSSLSWTLDETKEEKDLLIIEKVLQSLYPLKNLKNKRKEIFKSKNEFSEKALPFQKELEVKIPENYRRTSSFLNHPVFNSHHTETKLLRYITHLQGKELSLAHSMIPLGSCTMKLNATTELAPLSWPEFADIHPFAPKDQTFGYLKLMEELNQQLCALTGFSRFSFQPNAGSQGEYAGLLAIKRYHESRKESHRNICLIPASAHGTNPASAVIVGFKPVTVNCKKTGEIDGEDLKKKIQVHEKNLAAMMITYPSTHGVFEEGILDICNKVHRGGGLVYLDGANMNAMLGISKPHHLGFDVCHLNLHKTFCIPHGGGGPGAGPVGVSEKLKNFLPGHSQFENSKGAVSSAPYGSAGLLIIPWAYITLMGYQGLKKSGEIAIANANYIAERLKNHYRILFTGGKKNRVAHECIIDCRKFKNTADISVDDIAKRLMDYGFHAPTMSWPVPGTFMIEPTESESLDELDRFCEALIAIREEIAQVEKKETENSLLKNAPHTLADLMKKDWPFHYSKEQAFFPKPWVKANKFWPPVARIENSYGDINLFCSCPPPLT